jgi:hypothetical protein
MSKMHMPGKTPDPTENPDFQGVLRNLKEVPPLQGNARGTINDLSGHKNNLLEDDVTITPEMVAAGVERMAELPRDEPAEWIVRWVYLAMENERRSRR